jgi:hypothetical protein
MHQIVVHGFAKLYQKHVFYSVLLAQEQNQLEWIASHLLPVDIPRQFKRVLNTDMGI